MNFDCLRNGITELNDWLLLVFSVFSLQATLENLSDYMNGYTLLSGRIFALNIKYLLDE